MYEWIPVDNRTPLKGMMALVTTQSERLRYNRVRLARYIGEGRWVDVFTVKPVTNIVAWGPVPTPSQIQGGTDESLVDYMDSRTAGDDLADLEMDDVRGPSELSIYDLRQMSDEVLRARSFRWKDHRPQQILNERKNGLYITGTIYATTLRQVIKLLRWLYPSTYDFRAARDHYNIYAMSNEEGNELIDVLEDLKKEVKEKQRKQWCEDFLRDHNAKDWQEYFSRYDNLPKIERDKDAYKLPKVLRTFHVTHYKNSERKGYRG